METHLGMRILMVRLGKACRFGKPGKVFGFNYNATKSVTGDADAGNVVHKYNLCYTC